MYVPHEQQSEKVVPAAALGDDEGVKKLSYRIYGNTEHTIYLGENVRIRIRDCHMRFTRLHKVEIDSDIDGSSHYHTLTEQQAAELHRAIGRSLREIRRRMKQ